MKKTIALLIVISFWGSSTLADPSHVNQFPSLGKPFNFKQFQKCQTRVKKACPPKPVLPDFKCTHSLLQRTHICHQSQRLINLVMGDIYTLQVTKHDGFFIVNNYTIADGKNNYSIITPKGYILNTVIDIRQYDMALKKKYKKRDFLTLNHGKPKIFMSKKGATSIIVPLKINDTCVACKTIGYADVGFYFKKTGVLRTIKIIRFTPMN
jgi:hypothetical protein